MARTKQVRRVTAKSEISKTFLKAYNRFVASFSTSYGFDKKIIRKCLEKIYFEYNIILDPSVFSKEQNQKYKRAIRILEYLSKTLLNN